MESPRRKALNKKFFNEAPVGSGPQFIADSALPFIRPTADLARAAGGESLDPVLDALPLIDPSNKTQAEAQLSGRFGLGLPFDRVSIDQQTSSAYNLRRSLIDALQDQNKGEGGLEEKGIRVSLSDRKDGASFRVRDITIDETIFESQDANEALEFARRLAARR